VRYILGRFSFVPGDTPRGAPAAGHGAASEWMERAERSESSSSAKRALYLREKAGDPANEAPKAQNTFAIEVLR
jgi:hypothetical protein